MTMATEMVTEYTSNCGEEPDSYCNGLASKRESRNERSRVEDNHMKKCVVIVLKSSFAFDCSI